MRREVCTVGLERFLPGHEVDRKLFAVALHTELAAYVLAVRLYGVGRYLQDFGHFLGGSAFLYELADLEFRKGELAQIGAFAQHGRGCAARQKAFDLFANEAGSFGAACAVAVFGKLVQGDVADAPEEAHEKAMKALEEIRAAEK